MIILAVDSVGAATSGKKWAEISSAFLVEQIRSIIPHIELRITSCKRGLFFFVIFGTDVLGVPKIVLFIAFFISIIVGQGCFNLFPSGPFFSLCKCQPFILLLLKILFWDVLVYVKP